MPIPPFSSPGRFWRGNLHTHSHLSDGALEPEQVVDAYKRAGYDFLQLSDISSSASAGRSPIRGSFAPIVSRPDLRGTACDGHRGRRALAHSRCRPAARFPARAGRGNRSGTRGAGASGGRFVAIAHPAWSQLRIGDGRALDSAHAVEIYNHGCAVETDRGDGFYLLDELSNEGRRLTAIATDDAISRTATTTPSAALSRSRPKASIPRRCWMRSRPAASIQPGAAPARRRSRP